jgi:ribosome-associated protein
MQDDLPDIDLDPQGGQHDHRDARPSKTALKQQAHELQALGQALVELPDDRLEAAAGSERLVDAVREFKRTRSHEGRRRQMQYIGKLMRGIDTSALREAVAAQRLPDARESLRLHEAERWRAELVASDDALTRWAAEHPRSDVQQLRQLVRAARKDAALPPEQRHGRSWRELFRFIKPHLDETTQDETDHGE